MTSGYRMAAVLGAILGAAALLVAAAALIASGDDGSSASAASGEWPVTASIRPDLTPLADLDAAPDGEEHLAYAPAVPEAIDRSDQRIFDVQIESIEGVCPIDPEAGVSTEMWGFRIAGDDQVTCGSPGPIVRGRVGDVVNISLTNLATNTHPHNIDFHAVTGQGGGAADLTANPGETQTIQIRLLYPGAFMYHCAYGDVPMHIAHGMYGMFIVDPETPLPEVDHEWAVMQSEWYVSEPNASGVAAYDADAVFNEEPRYVTFNGRRDALTGDNTLAMDVGERARIYFVNEGLALDSNFHPIGSQWDLVYPEAATHPANVPIRGSQSTLVTTGGGTVVEVDGLVPETIILVDHALGRTFYKGAIGTIVVSGDAQPELFSAVEADAGNGATATATSEPAAEIGAEVTITVDAFDPANADDAYDPRELTIEAGTTVRWTNMDAIAHTVTSGVSDGTSGTPDGTFDSGFLNEGDTFTYTFEEPGEFDYYCTPHPWMQGKVIVTPAQ
jgi:nitrite reductase (NO-forming)